jgi:NRPS condensation-like uncharacterized protein
MSLKNVEDFYPLSPVQQGMLFHSLLAPRSGVYVEQTTCAVQGDLNIAAFERAWQQVVDRYPVLRSSFVWENVAEPVQVVQRQVPVTIEQHDWRDRTAVEQAAGIEAFMQADRERGFALARAPLMRLALIRLSDDTVQFFWSFHHLLLDGWSTPTLLRHVFAGYEALRRGQEPRHAPERPYRDYIAWLRRQDMAAAEAFWRQALQGFAAPTPLGLAWPPDQPPDAAQTYAEQQVQLPSELLGALQSYARRHRLTINTLVQGAWALLLSRYARGRCSSAATAARAISSSE